MYRSHHASAGQFPAPRPPRYNWGMSEERRPSYWRAFWVTAALVGTVNVAFSIYVVCLPETPTGKGGRMVKAIPEWPNNVVLALNVPGFLACSPAIAAKRQRHFSLWP